MAFYGYARFTEDIDFLIREGDIARAKKLLEPLGFDLPAAPVPFATGTPQARLLHRVSKAGGPALVTIDLMVVTPVFEDREHFEWQGRLVQVVSGGGLAKMKKLAGRSKDLMDLQELGLIDEETET